MVIRPVVTESREIGTAEEAQDAPMRSPPLLPATGKHDVSAREVPLPKGRGTSRAFWWLAAIAWASLTFSFTNKPITGGFYWPDRSGAPHPDALLTSVLAREIPAYHRGE